ncbi:MAG TPA: response regulator transcription factor [Spirochaetota bacterium]|nr:response regulator transcription factor [Spirochaetota bacterium]HRZ25277.1 response regulator transcription factor [Spirochaetota bacterium]HSA13554.1 response regulator transcription factor [Spirochaetota bacterium]
MINIIIADDHEIVRAGLKQIISDSKDMLVKGEARDGQELLEKVREGDYDVILLDIKMPGRSGLEILKQLKVEYADIPVIVLSMHPEDQYAVRTIKGGASGYLTKETAGEKLIEAIKKVYRGGKYISPTLAEKLADSIANDREKPLHEYLTDREYQVVCMIASGKTVTEIAQDLFLSVKTISTYRQRILEKMNMKNNAELTHYVINNHLIE